MGNFGTIPHALQREPTLLDACMAAHDDDQFGSLRYLGWFSDGTRLTRQMVLTREGVLEEAGATIVRVAPPTVNLSVTIGRDDRWGVRRGGP